MRESGAGGPGRGGRYLRRGFPLNVVLDEHKNVIHAVAGELKEAHRQGCRFLDGFYRMEINELADIVIVSGRLQRI
ncbi:MAG: hypothetical protein ACLTBV_27935 [Enterocloster bolteae]